MTTKTYDAESANNILNELRKLHKRVPVIAGSSVFKCEVCLTDEGYDGAVFVFYPCDTMYAIDGDN